MLEVESDQIGLIGKILGLENTMRVFPGMASQAGEYDRLDSDGKSTRSMQSDVTLLTAGHLTPDTFNVSTESGGGSRNEYTAFISGLDDRVVRGVPRSNSGIV
jgi:VCBS repeat-containing protein